MTDQIGQLLQNSGIPNFPSNTASLGSVLSAFLTLAIYLAAFLCFFWLVWGAFTYIAAGGDKEKLGHGRSRMTMAIIGLLIVMIAYFVAQFAGQIFRPVFEQRPGANPLPGLNTLIPVAYAQTASPVDIGQTYAFGPLGSLGEGVRYLVVPTFSIAGALVVIYFLIGAFKFLTSGGDKEAVSGAQKMIQHAIIGFICLIFAFLIMEFLSQTFGLPNITGR